MTAPRDFDRRLRGLDREIGSIAGDASGVYAYGRTPAQSYLNLTFPA